MARRIKSVEGLWLFLALLLHLLLLIVPFNQPPKPPEVAETISVVMDIQSKQQLYSEPVERDLPPPIEQPSSSQEEQSQPAPLATREVEQSEPEPSVVERPSTSVTAAQLLLGVSELKFEPPASDEKRQLGDAESVELPANWLPTLKLEDNLFTGKTGSGKAEIMDQWKSTDGAYNVIVKTPSGKTFCGHAPPQQRISSLEEPVVVWRSCD